MKKIAFALLILLMLTAADKERTTTIFMIGDSTMANKDISKGKKERGWGMALQCFFDDNIVIDNHAVNGRSSLSFINEGRWDAVLKKIKPGDYVIIQFGHNDEKPKADRHTDPGSTFDYNLAKFVRETREHGGTPILMNCVVRRNIAKVAPKTMMTKPFAIRSLPMRQSLLKATHLLTLTDYTAWHHAMWQNA